MYILVCVYVIISALNHENVMANDSTITWTVLSYALTWIMTDIVATTSYYITSIVYFLDLT